MTDKNLFDALEICLQSLDQGGDVESCLARFPKLADELRPILTAAVQARSISVIEVPPEALRRGKARVLQAAAEMREQASPAPAIPFWHQRRTGFFGGRFLRLAITTALMLVFLLTGGTGLVNASNSALPGDNLYPVKRSWEGVRLFFVFDSHAKVQLENEFDHERVQEIEELYSEKRVAQVNFQGVVQARNDTAWVVGGLNIAVNDKTELDDAILSGSTVQVIGETDDGHIKAEQIYLIATPGVTPTGEPSSTLEATPQPGASRTPEPSDDHGDDQKKPVETPDLSEPTKRPDDSPEIKPTEDHPSEPHPTEYHPSEPQPTESHSEPQPTESHSEPQPTRD
jgi:hypothetical protein